MSRARHRLPRRSALPLVRLTPSEIDSPWPDMPPPRQAREQPWLVVDNAVPAGLLLGRDALAAWSRARPGAALPCRRVAPPDAEAADAIMALEDCTTLADYAAGVTALHRSGMPLTQIREVVRGAGHVPELSKTVLLYQQTPALFALADASRGTLRLSHLLALAAVRPAQHEALARDVMANKRSVKDLKNNLAPAPPANADIAALAAQLGQALGTTVELDYASGKGELRIAWDTVPALQGVLEQLARGDGDPANRRRRFLTLPFDDLDEYDALVGHLGAP